MARFRVTVDTGGTFSDFVYLNEETGAVTIAKLPSTPDDPSRAILAGLEALLAEGVAATDIGYFCHGTTVGTNALLEGKGVRTGLLVTEGFRGVYPVGEQARPYGTAIFDVMYDKPEPLVPPSQTGEVEERVDFRGNVLRPLDEAALRAPCASSRRTKIESIAVCLLFSFLHPQHERACARSCARKCRTAASRSRPRCCRRSASTIGSAPPSSTPICSRSWRATSRSSTRASPRPASSPGSLHHAVERRHGDVCGAARARRHHRAVGAGRRRDRRRRALPHDRLRQNLITFDMGGTSCDVALIKDGEPLVASRGKIDGRDLAVPMMDINTVSAGGGTIAEVDRFGALEVGPQSAGAVPGRPATAAAATTRPSPTATWCWAISARTISSAARCGSIAGKARNAHRDEGRQPLGLSVEAAAEGIIRIIDVKMAEAIKAISTMRGHDLRDFMLLAFGGAGPVHAGRLRATSAWPA